MDCFLKFLIYNLRTIDGKRGTADKMLEAMNKASEEEYKKDHKR